MPRYIVGALPCTGVQYPTDNHKEIDDKKSKNIKSNPGSRNSITYTGNKSIAERIKEIIGSPDGSYPCPDCSKPLKVKARIAKHLLSHLPQSEWPFVCLFCGKHMQDKSDLPKHWRTGVHANNPQIPKPGTPEFNTLLKNSQVIDPWPPKIRDLVA